MTAQRFAGWMPIRVYWDGYRPMVDWCHMGDERFTDPFFDITIERRLWNPFALLFRRQTTLEALPELQQREPGLPPTGFIFHLSRCGSTLVSQMLASLPQNIVISEAGPIDTVLRANTYDPAVSEEQRVAWLRALVSALGRPRSGVERHYFIKLDSWHTLDLPLLQRAFPDVPWLFLYRHPVEVIASHNRQKGSQMIPGALPPAYLGLSPAAVTEMSWDAYGVHVLACICRVALQHRDAQARFMNYTELPEAACSTVLEHFGVHFSDEELAEMRAASRLDAKNPVLPFSDDTQAKQQAVAGECRALVERVLMPLYEELEAVRCTHYPAKRHFRTVSTVAFS